jgi:catechol 2,3-dioxygenase-like lactoylglutathione lyase family enzyme
MASRSHHVACVTDDPEAVVAFLQDIVGLEVTGRLVAPGDATTAILGWPENDGAEGWMLGQGPGGLVEVIRIPDELRDRVTPGFALISFATPDIEGIVERCREHGVAVAEPVHTPSLGLTGTVATVGGLAFELLRFERPSDDES